MRARILLHFLFFVLAVLPLKGHSSSIDIREINLLAVNSAITPATFDYLKQNFEKLPETSLIVLKLNTPGGLVSTTKDIITMIGTKKRPFVVWITPEGASAASAGAIIASAAHLIFMSPGTNIGAATPVGLGEDIAESDGRKKAMNDLTALVRSLSISRGRPSEPFERMITKAESYTATEAQKLGIIDGIISSERDMLKILENRKINLDGIERTIRLQDPVFQVTEPSPGQKILEVLANPTTAYILFLIGVALIYFEFQAPGGFIAGSVGLCFLILAGIAFQVLPLDWGSMGLIIAGIFLLILELYIVSYGILSVAGIIAFVMGSLFLFHGEAGFISVHYYVIISSMAGIFAAIGLVVWLLYRDRKQQRVVDNFFLPTGARGRVLTKLGPLEYQVKVKGEIWHAFSDEELNLNAPVEVVSVDTVKLRIKIKKDISST